MTRPAPTREDAIAVWRAGVAAVASDRLVRDAVAADGDGLTILGERFAAADWDRLVVVGAGKAGAGMAAGFADAVAGTPWAGTLTGFLNVPADCVRHDVPGFTLHAGRPAGVNEPRPEGVAGTRRILDLVGGCGPRDLCVVLLSGGGSALLVAPAAGITLADKQRVTRLLAGRGASIGELNAVRKRLSAVKGGGLARACGAGRAVCLAISDVIGDPLPVIASGPTVADAGGEDPADVLRRFVPDEADLPPAVWAAVRRGSGERSVPPTVTTRVIGSNAVAQAACVDHIARHADRLPFFTAGERQDPRAAPSPHTFFPAVTGVARHEGPRLLRLARETKANAPPRAPVCLVSGGEPTVTLCNSPGKGGRNQELVLAAVAEAWDDPAGFGGAVILSGGTDGEDGPTDAAGALADDALLARAKSLGLHPRPFLDRNDAYPFFETTGGLLKTGPTHTNVMDLRVVLVP